MRAARQKCDILSSQHVGLGCAQSSLPNAPAGCCGVEVELGRVVANGVDKVGDNSESVLQTQS